MRAPDPDQLIILVYQRDDGEPIAHYGQLAAKRLGEKRLALRTPPQRRQEGHRAPRRFLAPLPPVPSGIAVPKPPQASPPSPTPAIRIVTTEEAEARSSGWWRWKRAAQGDRPSLIRDSLPRRVQRLAGKGRELQRRHPAAGRDRGGRGFNEMEAARGCRGIRLCLE